METGACSDYKKDGKVQSLYEILIKNKQKRAFEKKNARSKYSVVQ